MEASQFLISTPRYDRAGEDQYSRRENGGLHRSSPQGLSAMPPKIGSRERPLATSPHAKFDAAERWR